MAPRKAPAKAPPAQLTLDTLAAAQAKVPAGVWTALTHRQQAFVCALLADPTQNQERAALAAGYARSSAKSWGFKLMKLPLVRAAIDVARAERIERTGITADEVLRRWWGIATADPNALVTHRRTCCRFCHGTSHEYQFTPNEMRRARENFEARQTKASKEQFDPQGGDGYDRRKEPHPECPECFGDGEGHVFIADTRRLAGDAALLYAGTKETDKGIEVKLHSQEAALANVARHLGMFAERDEPPEDADRKAAKIRAALDAMDGVTLGAAA